MGIGMPWASERLPSGAWPGEEDWRVSEGFSQGSTVSSRGVDPDLFFISFFRNYLNNIVYLTQYFPKLSFPFIIHIHVIDEISYIPLSKQSLRNPVHMLLLQPRSVGAAHWSHHLSLPLPPGKFEFLGHPEFSWHPRAAQGSLAWQADKVQLPPKPLGGNPCLKRLRQGTNLRSDQSWLENLCHLPCHLRE